jgi:hypothetical protein
MWRINSSKFTLQEVLIMAYMNVLEGTQRSSREAVRTPTRSGLSVIGGQRPLAAVDNFGSNLVANSAI